VENLVSRVLEEIPVIQVPGAAEDINANVALMAVDRMEEVRPLIQGPGVRALIRMFGGSMVIQSEFRGITVGCGLENV